MHRNPECLAHKSTSIESDQKGDTRVNIDILGNSELKWTGMDEFNSDDHYIYYHGQESLRRNGSVPHSQENSVKCSIWVQSQK